MPSLLIGCGRMGDSTQSLPIDIQYSKLRGELRLCILTKTLHTQYNEELLFFLLLLLLCLLCGTCQPRYCGSFVCLLVCLLVLTAYHVFGSALHGLDWLVDRKWVTANCFKEAQAIRKSIQTHFHDLPESIKQSFSSPEYLSYFDCLAIFDQLKVLSCTVSALSFHLSRAFKNNALFVCVTSTIKTAFRSRHS